MCSIDEKQVLRKDTQEIPEHILIESVVSISKMQRVYDFMEVYGLEPSYMFCPNVCAKLASNLPKSLFQLVKARARMMRFCAESDFPQLIKKFK